MAESPDMDVVEPQPATGRSRRVVGSMAVRAICRGPKGEGCPKDMWVGADDEQHLIDLGWATDPTTGLFLCEFCQGILYALERLLPCVRVEGVAYDHRPSQQEQVIIKIAAPEVGLRGVD